MKKFLSEFKEFALRGNVLDMAIGVVIGGAFGKITTSLVNDVIMPLVGMLIGGIDLSQLDIVLKPAVMNGDEVVTAAVTLGIGTFLTTIIDFILVALVIFLMIKAINRFHKKKEEAPAPEEPKGPTSEELLTEIRDLLNEYEFPGDDTPIIKGSALKALEDPSSEWGDKILELMAAVDDYIPEPIRDTEKPFLMPVEDVFSITGRGTVATGRVERGVLKVSDEVEIVGIADEIRKVVVTGVEMFRKLLDQAQTGDNIGALLRGVQRTDIERGQVLAAPGSVHPHTKFKGEVYVLKKEEGGRHTPFFNGYRPQFYFRTTDVTGDLKLPEGTEMCMPGDNVVMEIELITPIAIEEGLRFAIREGGRTVGSGVVTEIIE